MPALSKSQRLILTSAAERDDGAVLPLPDALARRGRAIMMKSLIARGLVIERPAHAGEPCWRRGAHDDQGTALAITAEGRALIQAGRQAPSPRQQRRSGAAAGRRRKPTHREPNERATRRVARSLIRPGTKQALLVEMLHRPEGATIAEVQQATGWQAHSVRAALTGLKKKSFTLASALRGNGTRSYHLATQGAGGDEQPV